MTKGKNKNQAVGGRRLLKVTYREEQITWKDILVHLVFIANIFKDCLMYLHNKNVYILTLTSAELLVSLQEVSPRKACGIEDINLLYHTYGYCHTYAIFWTDKGKVKVLPDCIETLQIFRNIDKEATGTYIMPPGIIYVELSSLFGESLTNKTKLQKKGTLQLFTVNVVNDTSYYKDYNGDNTVINKESIQRKKVKTISLTRKSRNGNVKVSYSNWHKEDTICPFTGNENVTNDFPQQVSGEHENEGQSQIVFSSGASFRPLPGHHIGSLPSSQQTLIPTSVADRVMPRYPDYMNLQERIRSYQRWTHRKPDPAQLSEAGFFFTEQGDLVRCFQCGIGLKDFTEGDNPLHEHVKYSSRCSFLLEYLGQSHLSSLLNQLQAHDPEFNRQRQVQISQRTRPEVNYMSVRHPEYQDIDSRLRTFEKWPRHLIQTPRQLSEAGLYYTGFEDHVRCFACDGGLRRWDPEDDPWTEHCRWFPACPFARVEKGDEFIALVQASADYGNEDNSEDLSNTMQQMTLRDPVYNAALNEHKDACLEMGYKLTDFNEAAKEIRERGTILPQLDEILDTIEVIKERKRQELEQKKKQDETPVEENQRLKRLVICMFCGRNQVNALFLPCTHHRLCMTCAELVTSCPVCDRDIRQKIRTYLV